jgi:histidine triad (HIT) family protein
MENKNFLTQPGIEKEILFENEHCVFLDSSAYLPPKVLEGSGMIVTKRYIETPFELTAEELISIFEMLTKVRDHLMQKYQPDGFNVGWNIGEAAGQNVSHAHLHVLARYNDEPLAGKGIRNYLKREDNARQGK